MITSTRSGSRSCCHLKSWSVTSPDHVRHGYKFKARKDLSAFVIMSVADQANANRFGHDH